MEQRGSQLPSLKLQLPPTIIMATSSQYSRECYAWFHVEGWHKFISFIGFGIGTCKCALRDMAKGHATLGNHVLEIGI